MNHLEEKYGWLASPPAYVSLKNEVRFRSPLVLILWFYSLRFLLANADQADKMIVFERAGLLFIFNFNPTQSFADYRVGVEEAGEYGVALSSDEKRFAGFERVDLKGSYFTNPMEWNGRKNFLQVYIPVRTCLVLAKK